jgi:hypothetical protein
MANGMVVTKGLIKQGEELLVGYGQAYWNYKGGQRPEGEEEEEEEEEGEEEEKQGRKGGKEGKEGTGRRTRGQAQRESGAKTKEA